MARHDGTARGEGEAVLRQLLLAFEGDRPPAWAVRRVAEGSAVGMTVFRFSNVRGAGQVRELTAELAAAAPDDQPLLIAADQEGGQLVGLGSGSTEFPGAMALGAAGDPALTEQIGRATGLELRALGVTVCYAPVCDLALTPRNVSLGTRSFGSRAEEVAEHVAAFTRGLVLAGVAATPKHYPGEGGVTVDTHHTLGVVDQDRAGLESRELRPFRAAFAAGANMVMTGHFAVPRATGKGALPATLSPRLMTEVLRREMGFRGVAITDAIDMKALAQGAGQLVEAISALRAGVDLLLATPDRAAQRRLEDGLRQAALRGLVPLGRTAAADRRIRVLRAWLAGFDPPDPSVVRSRAHLALARRAAERALTLVRDDAGLLPLRPAAGDRLAVVVPEPRDLTPADSSSTEALDLAGAIRRYHPDVLDIRSPAQPQDADIAAVVAAAEGCRLAVVGTVATNVQPGQARLVRALLATSTPVVTVALRTPYDLADYPAARTHLCSYAIVPPAVDALASGLFGRAAITGRLPVPIPGLYAAGRRAETSA